MTLDSLPSELSATRSTAGPSAYANRTDGACSALGRQDSVYGSAGSPAVSYDAVAAGHGAAPQQPDVDRRPPSRLRWITRAFARNWVIELSVFVALAVIYNVVRALPTLSDVLAFRHARYVMSAEGPIFQLVELPLNKWMTGIPVVAIAACYFYAVMHYAATPIVFWMSRRRGGWQYWRGYWSLVVASGIALLIYALYPVAPPRLVPDLNVVDVMRAFAGYGWWGDAASAPRGIGDATNQFAAMPSMHFGWALWCSIQMWGFKTWRWRAPAIAYPSVLAVVVLATGNHFLLDLVGGALCVVIALIVVRAFQPRHERAVAAGAEPGSLARRCPKAAAVVANSGSRSAGNGPSASPRSGG